ncbi:hypothetical protein CRG98_005090 [Punica granatum]|uniref:Uncharacterized protein n=1 Tax=Punica granatum TaxID=22663 RepID=A0A2I0L1K4_PUNGR|nr:hypothetical protein CRG98_005090 [Punica granatum]
MASEPRTHPKHSSTKIDNLGLIGIVYSRTLSIQCSFKSRNSNTTVRVDPATLGTNDHHDHLEGSLGYPRPPTLPQNSIGSLHGDVRPDLCQSGLPTLPVGSIATIRVCSSQNSPNPTHQRPNPTLEGPIPPLGVRYDHSRPRGARTFILLLCLWSFKGF